MRDARVFVQTMITLASASLGLVAALAWNEAIKATIKEALGDANGLTGLYTYAIVATILSVVVLSILASIASKLGGEARIKREVD
ncbi:MAG: DUF5654 family protein [Acidobacteriota bacterium]